MRALLNFSGSEMKSVHSYKAAPNRQLVEQSNDLNEGHENGGVQRKTPPIENPDRKRTPSV